MKEFRHIALGGEIGIGKTTLINRLLAETKLPVAGFMTKLDRNQLDKDDMFPLYIYPAGIPEEERTQSEENLLGACAGRNKHKAYADKFDCIAVPMITNVPEGTIIVMDELGFLESEAEQFKKVVFEVLKKNNPMIITIKDRFDVPFLNELRADDSISYFRVTEENRDDLFEELAEVVRNWK